MGKNEMVELKAQLAALMAENEALKARGAKRITFKVSEKGGVSVYGLGRFPVSLYRSQWEKLFGEVDALKAFIEANKEKLSEKPAVALASVG